MSEEKMMNILTEDGVTIFAFSAISISNSSGIELVAAEVRQYLESTRPERVIVDFDGVKFFSSLLLGLLVEIWKKMKAYDGTMVISGINPRLNRVFRITNLDKIFEFHPDRQTALKALTES
ncbi:MAG TPA: anti-sigma factor antagonist [Phycisphaerales bacterium]|nr:anti-sigma factor antagonist [Phycisphaerales bacterium]